MSLRVMRSPARPTEPSAAPARAQILPRGRPLPQPSPRRPAPSPWGTLRGLLAAAAPPPAAAPARTQVPKPERLVALAGAAICVGLAVVAGGSPASLVALGGSGALYVGLGAWLSGR